MANISNVINVALLAGGALADRDNMNVVCIVTSESDFLNTSKRTSIYVDAQSVAADFGTASKANDFAQVLFSQSPNPINAGGHLVMGYWRAVDETVPAQAGILTGAQLSEAILIGQLQAIQDGSFSITVDGGTEQVVTGVDFRAVTSIKDILEELNSEITDAVVTEVDQRFIITSDTASATSELTFLSNAGTGTDVGSILALATGTGAALTAGANASTLAAESKEEAITAIKAAVNIKGAMFIDNPTDVESKSLAEWAQANSVLMYDVFDHPNNLLIAPSNVVWDIKLAGLSKYRMMYSKAGSRKLAVGMMARAHIVNFNAENSAITMHLKELRGVAAEAYTQTEISGASKVGLDIYTTIKNVPIVLTSGANDFLDNVYNLMAFIDAVQTDMFNLLKGTASKIPQTTKGVNQLLAQGTKTTRGFVRAGVFAGGTWSSPDTFGDIDVFNRSIEKNGFYWMAGNLADQPQSDREARKSPVLQCAVKNAGAFHSVDIIINFNK
jgi:hypothetical protein